MGETRDRWALNLHLHLRSDDARCLALACSLHACAVLDGGSSPDAYSLHACAWVDLVVWRPLVFVVFLVVGKPKGIPWPDGPGFFPLCRGALSIPP